MFPQRHPVSSRPGSQRPGVEAQSCGSGLFEAYRRPDRGRPRGVTEPHVSASTAAGLPPRRSPAGGDHLGSLYPFAAVSIWRAAAAWDGADRTPKMRTLERGLHDVRRAKMPAAGSVARPQDVPPGAASAWSRATSYKRGEVVFMGAGRTCSCGQASTGRS